MARVGGGYVSLELVPDEMLAKRRGAVRSPLVMAFEILGEGGSSCRVGYGKAADPAKRGLGVRFFTMFQRLLNEGKLVTQRVDGGLEGIAGGFAIIEVWESIREETDCDSV